MTDAGTRTVVLKPGDTLLIGNVGALDDEAIEALAGYLAPVARALGLSAAAIFEGDIDMATAAPLAPAADAVVLRVFDREAVAKHRDALVALLRRNGIDPVMVDDDWLSIEQAGDLRLVRYLAFRLDQDGRRLADPRRPGRPWTVERVAPVTGETDILEIGLVTESDIRP